MFRVNNRNSWGRSLRGLADIDHATPGTTVSKPGPQEEDSSEHLPGTYELGWPTTHTIQKAVAHDPCYNHNARHHV